ncbi:hypothetical protein [Pseudomonas sp. V98_8]
MKVALRIIAAWQVTAKQACSIMRISHSTFRRSTLGV